MFAYLTSALRWMVGLVVMTFWILAIAIFSLFAPPRRLHGLWKFGFRMITRVAGLRITVRGLEHLDPTKGYLYMPNHVNSFEPFIAMPAIPQWVVAIEKQANFKLPIYGLLIKRWGNIPIDRENIESAKRSLTRAREALASGESIAIMPEGTRSKDGSLGPFKKGGFHLAIEAGATIVPYAYKGLHAFNQHGSLLLRPCAMEVVFTPPIDASAYTKDELPALMARVRAQILEALDQTETQEASELAGAARAE